MNEGGVTVSQETQTDDVETDKKVKSTVYEKVDNAIRCELIRIVRHILY